MYSNLTSYFHVVAKLSLQLAGSCSLENGSRLLIEKMASDLTRISLARLLISAVACTDSQLKSIRTFLISMRHIYYGQAFARTSFTPSFTIHGEGRDWLIFKEDTLLELLQEGSFGPSQSSPVFGLDNEQNQLKHIFDSPFKQRNRLSAFGVRPPKGVLLFGPPGTGKTALAMSVASDFGLALFLVDGSEVAGRYFGETETRVHLSILTSSLVYLDSKCLPPGHQCRAVNHLY